MWINCPGCKLPVEVPVSQPIVQNFENFSQVLVEHPGQTACRCGAVFQVIIAKLGEISLALLPVPPEKRRSILIPASALLPGKH